MIDHNHKIEFSGKERVELAMITDDKYCVFTAIALTSLKEVKDKVCSASMYTSETLGDEDARHNKTLHDV